MRRRRPAAPRGRARTARVRSNRSPCIALRECCRAAPASSVPCWASSRSPRPRRMLTTGTPRPSMAAARCQASACHGCVGAPGERARARAHPLPAPELSQAVVCALRRDAAHKPLRGVGVQPAGGETAQLRASGGAGRAGEGAWGVRRGSAPRPLASALTPPLRAVLRVGHARVRRDRARREQRGACGARGGASPTSRPLLRYGKPCTCPPTAWWPSSASPCSRRRTGRRHDARAPSSPLLSPAHPPPAAQLIAELRLLCDGSTGGVHGLIRYIGAYFAPGTNTVRRARERRRAFLP